MAWPRRAKPSSRRVRSLSFSMSRAPVSLASVRRTMSPADPPGGARTTTRPPAPSAPPRAGSSAASASSTIWREATGTLSPRSARVTRRPAGSSPPRGPEATVSTYAALIGSGSSGHPEERAGPHDEDQRIDAGDQVVEHDAEPARERLALPGGERLPDVEDTEEHEGRDQDGNGPGKRQDREQHAGDLVDHDHARVLKPEHPFHPRRGPNAERGHGDERPEQGQPVERHEPEGDEGDEAGKASRGHRRAPRASNAGDGEGQAIGEIGALTLQPARSRPPRRWQLPRSPPA